MSIKVTNAAVRNNPSPLPAALSLHLIFQCLLPVDLITWTLTHISSESPSDDQTLYKFDMGPLTPGIMIFTIECDPPNYSVIPVEAIFGRY